jgi:hypothetical protein
MEPIYKLFAKKLVEVDAPRAELRQHEEIQMDENS